MSLPGMTWRILAHKRPDSGYSYPALDLSFKPSQHVEFDELVVGEWFHMEQMDDRFWWMRIGDVTVHVRIPARGKPVVSVEREEEP